MEFLLILLVVVLLFWLGFRITGALLSAAFWLCIKLPLALVVFCLGIVLCATLILIPVGLRCFRLAGKILF